MGVTFIDGSQAEVGAPICVIYGPPGAGKTSLALTAERPALLDFDGGAHRASNRAGKAILPIKRWQDVADLSEADLQAHSTIVVDTVGECLESMARDIISRDPSMGTGGSLSLRGFGQLKARFAQWIGLVRSFGKSVVLVAHMNEEQRGDRTMERIVAQGGSRNLVYQVADLMGRLSIGPDGRCLTFDSSLTSYGKNPGIADTLVPPPEKEPALLASILAAASARMAANASQTIQAETAAQPAGSEAEAAPPPTDANDPSPAQKTLDDLNARVAAMEADPNARKAEKLDLVRAGVDGGFVFDKAAKRFAMPAETAEGEPF